TRLLRPVNPGVPVIRWSAAPLVWHVYFTARTTRTTGHRPRDAFDRPPAPTYITLGICSVFSGVSSQISTGTYGRISPLGSRAHVCPRVESARGARCLRRAWLLLVWLGQAWKSTIRHCLLKRALRRTLLPPCAICSTARMRLSP